MHARVLTADIAKPQEAVTALLGRSQSYGHAEELASSTLLSYYPGAALLPDINSPSPLVGDILDDMAAKTLVSFEQEILLEQSAFNARVVAEGRIKYYVDLMLSRDKSAFESLTCELK